MVGTEARIRVSSVMVDPSNGTFRSHRTRTLSERCSRTYFEGSKKVLRNGRAGSSFSFEIVRRSFRAGPKTARSRNNEGLTLGSKGRT